MFLSSKSPAGQSTMYLLTAFLSLPPQAERQPYPEQLFPADDILFFPEAG